MSSDQQQYPGNRTLWEWREWLKSRLRALEEDVEWFGPAGDDLSRIAGLKAELAKLPPEEETA